MSKYTFFHKIDELPRGADWIYDDVSMTGDRAGEDGKMMSEWLDLWRRDPVECVRELIGNPAFREVMSYTP